MQYNAAITSLHATLSEVSRVVTRYNSPGHFEAENGDGSGRMLEVRSTKIIVAGHHSNAPSPGEVSFHVKVLQARAEIGDALTSEGTCVKMKEEEQLFQRFDSLEPAMEHAGLGRRYQHAIVEIAASLLNNDCKNLIYGSTPSFHRPALAIFAEYGDQVVIVKIEE